MPQTLLRTTLERAVSPARPARLPGHRRALPAAALGSMLLAAALVAACAQKSPEERVTELRRGYEATLNGWVVRQEPQLLLPPLDEAAAGTEEGGAAGDAAAAAPPVGEGELAADAGAVLAEPEPATPVAQDVILDIVVVNNNNERLPGLTLDVEHVDAGEQAKGSYQIWIDTSQIGRGPGTQITQTLEDLPFVAGDKLRVEVREVPAGERSQYREYQSAGP